MIILDRREPADLSTHISRNGIEVAVMELESADVRFTGRGPDGREVLVGGERKRLSDLINSMKYRRLSGLQLRNMRQEHDFIFIWAEGVWRPGPGGEIEELRGREFRPFYSRDADRCAISYRQLTAYLTSLELCGQIVVRRTSSLAETASQYVGLWHWFNDKPWSAHHSHDQIYTDVPAKGHGGGWARPHTHNNGYMRGRAQSIPDDHPTTLWRMAAQLPGIDRRAQMVNGHFRTVRNMDLAGLNPEIRRLVDRWYKEHPEAAREAWEAMEGIGPATSRAAIKAITEEGA